MHPVFLEFGGLVFHSYVVMLALAFLIGVHFIFRRNERRAQPFPITPMGALWVFVGVLAGSKIYFVVQYGQWSDLLNVWRIWEGGLVSYGGMIGGAAAAIAYLRWNRAPIGPVGDLVLLYVPLCHAVGRIGCFLNGCCWGEPTALPWGVVYPAHTSIHAYLAFHHQIAGQVHASCAAALAQAAAHSPAVAAGAASAAWLVPKAGAAFPLPVHPTQLYSSMGLLLIFLILWRWYPRRRFDGAFLVAYPGLYGAMRFIVENFRGDTPVALWGMTSSQALSLGLALGAALLYPAVRRCAPVRENNYDSSGVDSVRD